MDYETAVLNTENTDKIREIVAYRIVIQNLKDIEKYVNLESLRIIECVLSAYLVCLFNALNKNCFLFI